MGENDRELALAVERPRTGETLEEHAAERIDISAAVDRAPFDLLRRNVVDRADEAALAGEAADGGDVSRQAEVADVNVLAIGPGGDENVPRLHVPVNEPGSMRRV